MTCIADHHDLPAAMNPAYRPLMARLDDRIQSAIGRNDTAALARFEAWLTRALAAPQTGAAGGRPEAPPVAADPHTQETT